MDFTQLVSIMSSDVTRSNRSGLVGPLSELLAALPTELLGPTVLVCAEGGVSPPADLAPPSLEPTVSVERVAQAIRGRDGRDSGGVTDVWSELTSEERDFLSSVPVGQRRTMRRRLVAAAIAAAWKGRQRDVETALRFGVPADRVAERARSDGIGALRHELVEPFRHVPEMQPRAAPSLESALQGVEDPVIELRPQGRVVQVHVRANDVRVFDGEDPCDDVPAALLSTLDDLSAEDAGSSGAADVVFEALVPEPGRARIWLSDLLYADGPAVDEPFLERRRRLGALVPAGRLLPVIAGGDVAAMADAATAAVADGAVTAVVRSAASIYLPGRPAALRSVDLAPPVSVQTPRLPSTATRAVLADDDPSFELGDDDGSGGLRRAHATRPVRHVDLDFPPYVAPELDDDDRPRRAVAVTRLTLLVWVVLLAGSTIGGQWPADDPVLDPALFESLGRFVGLVLVLVTTAGLWWSDQRTRNLHRLEGRRPGRARGFVVWPGVLIGVAFLQFVIVPLEPTELLDVRPFVFIAVFPVVVWLPYALVRRILGTLVRLRFDAMIAVAYATDVVTFALIWWWIETGLGEPGSSSAISEATTGVAIAVVATTIVGVVAWFAVLRIVDAAEGHRRASQRTRYEHRMLRLRGLDPSDPAIWWSLVQRRAEERHVLGSGEASRGMVDGVDASVERVVLNVRVRNQHALRRLGGEASSDLLDRLRSELAGIVNLPRRGASERDGWDDSLASHAPSSKRPRSPFHRWRRQLDADLSVDADPVEHLLDHAGSVQIRAAVDDLRARVAEGRERERLVPPRLYGLDGTRLVLVAALAVNVLAATWLLTRTLGAGANTAAPPSARAADIESGRRLFVLTSLLSVPLVPVWTFAVATVAARCDVEQTSKRRHGWLAAVAVSAAVVGIAVDRSTPMTVAFTTVLVATACAAVAGHAIVPIRSWFALRSQSTMLWAALVSLTAVLSFLAGFHRTVESIESLGTMTLASALIAVISAVTLALVALNADDLIDEFRISPELQVPAASMRRWR